MRFAIYFTPGPDHPLAAAAASWLGRDAFLGNALPLPELAELDHSELSFTTAAPRRYGFHGTIVAPFQAAPGLDADAVAAALDDFCAGQESFDIPVLTLGRLGSFHALVPDAPVEALDAMASAAVQHFHPMMAPLSEIDIARRDPDRLTGRQRKNLLRWGYPFVHEDFRFHMTLTGPVPAGQQNLVERAIRSHFAGLIDRPVTVDGLALFVEAEPGDPFVIRSLHRFSSAAALRRTALSHV